MIRVLFLCHGNTMILIDEYDVPLENAYFRGFYDEMIDFIRSLFNPRSRRIHISKRA